MVKDVITREQTYQAVELNVLVVDQTGTVELDQGEALDVLVRARSDAVEAPLPYVFVAFDDQAESVNLGDWWGAGGVGNIGCLVGLHDCAESITSEGVD